jgi:molybdopterin-containing oxidoreductase family iron-sulfur binding subunit
VNHLGDILSWTSFLGALRQSLEAQKALQGAGLRILTGAVASPTLANQLKELKALFPSMKAHYYEPVNNSNAIAGAKLAFGEPVEAVYNFEKAKVVFSIDADFLSSHPANLKNYTRLHQHTTFAGRQKRDESSVCCRNFSFKHGAKADHRLAVRASEMEAFVRTIAEKLGVEGVKGEASSADGKYIDTLVADLKANRGASVVIVGKEQSPMVHALTFAINNTLGNLGTGVTFVEALEPNTVDHTGIYQRACE